MPLCGLLVLCSTALAARSIFSPSGVSCSGSSEARLGCASTAIAAGEGEEDEGSEEGGGEEDAASAEASAEESGPSSNPQATNSGSSGNVVVLSRLRLTSSATSALKHRRPPASTVRFSFTLNAPAKLHVTIVKQTSGVGMARKKRWTTLPDSLILSAGQGRVERSLTGHNRLSPGRYRLTVKPITGNPRSIYLSTLG
jgi:hypothetical protein